MAFKVLGNILGANFKAGYSGHSTEEKVPEFRLVANGWMFDKPLWIAIVSVLTNAKEKHWILKIYLLLFLILNTLRKNMPVKFWDYEQTFLQFMMQKPLIKKSLVTFGQKNHNTIKSKLEKGKKKAYLCTMYCPQEHCCTALRPNSRRSQTVWKDCWRGERKTGRKT